MSFWCADWMGPTLSPGQQVITAGQYKVSPGTLVTTAVASSEAAQSRVQPE